MKKQYEMKKEAYLSPVLNVAYLQATDLICTSGEKEIGVQWDEAWDS
ncbi:MAG: hypothetical protein IJB97_02375 [Clostridia bacterium]|nr:hypothetical protein [Clostridia bacterium]